MTKNVMVYVKGTQKLPGQAAEEVQEVYTRGTYYEKGEKKYVFYDEALDENGDYPVRSTLCIDGDRFRMGKKGAAESNLLFGPGEVHDSLYRSPMGVMELRCQTKDIRMEEWEGQIRVQLHYDLYMNRIYIGENRVWVEITAIHPEE